MKSFGLIPLAEEISKQPTIDSIVCLLMVTLMKIYNENEQTKQSKLQNVNFEEKLNGSEMELNTVLKEIN